MASCWSGVSSKPKLSASARNHAPNIRRHGPAQRAAGVQVEQFGGGIAHLFGRFALGFSHWPEPSVCSGASSGEAPE
jgi:hypothetical protein